MSARCSKEYQAQISTKFYVGITSFYVQREAVVNFSTRMFPSDTAGSWESKGKGKAKMLVLRAFLKTRWGVFMAIHWKKPELQTFWQEAEARARHLRSSQDQSLEVESIVLISPRTPPGPPGPPHPLSPPPPHPRFWLNWLQEGGAQVLGCVSGSLLPGGQWQIKNLCCFQFPCPHCFSPSPLSRFRWPRDGTHWGNEGCNQCMACILVPALRSMEWEPLFVAREVKLIVMVLCRHCGTMLYM